MIVFVEWVSNEALNCCIPPLSLTYAAHMFSTGQILYLLPAENIISRWPLYKHVHLSISLHKLVQAHTEVPHPATCVATSCSKWRFCFTIWKLPQPLTLTCELQTHMLEYTNILTGVMVKSTYTCWTCWVSGYNHCSWAWTDFKHYAENTVFIFLSSVRLHYVTESL